LLLFLGLFTVLNASFDWFSIGLTRALLRRGLELGGWYPFALAIIDATLAAVIIACLTVGTVVSIQAFDELAAYGGGSPVLPLREFFDGLAVHPGAPEYWWAYALLLSTMVPSLLNLIIGGASLLRGVPGIPSVLLHSMPEGVPVLSWDRRWMAAVLTGQMVVGALFGIAAQVAIAVFVIALVVLGYVLPWLGFGLLALAPDVAAWDLPMQIGRLF
jgi:hypothetical protein